jgi:pimeloyl-ACP methyl ester carboxylesterase
VADGPLTVELTDGRRLEGWTAGTASEAVLFHVGTPSAGIPYTPLVNEAGRQGLRFLTYSRPGYAGSSRHEGRSVSDCAGDVVALADELELDRIHVVGWSGGGPHALACAALLPDRVASAATLGGVAPWDAEGLDWLAGMADENLAEFGAAVAGTEALQRFLEPLARRRVDVTAEQLVAGLGGLLTDVDRAAVHGPFADFLAATDRAAVSTGLWGWHDDDLAFLRGWGFAPSAIDVPVRIWHGRHDAMVPPAHAAWLVEAIPGAQSILQEDEGHLSLVGRFGEVLDDLLRAAA